MEWFLNSIIKFLQVHLGNPDKFGDQGLSGAHIAVAPSDSPVPKLL